MDVATRSFIYTYYVILIVHIIDGHLVTRHTHSRCWHIFKFQHMVNIDLPGEIWIQIFYLAADEDIIIQHGLPTILAESAWYKDRDDWKLRSPQEAMEMLQRRSYAVKKVNFISASCLTNVLTSLIIGSCFCV